SGSRRRDAAAKGPPPLFELGESELDPVKETRVSNSGAFARHRVSVTEPSPTSEGVDMPKYLCLQRSLPGGDQESGKPSPAQMQAMYAQFNEWREKFQKNLTDMGGRLGAGRLVTSQPTPDGPLVEVKELVGGYMIVTAATME